jgi:signal transduction histidine kinase
MSLRLRLTLIYTGVLSSVLLLLSVVVYSLISILFVNLVDSRLGEAADQIVTTLWANPSGEIEIDTDALNIADNYYYQVWSADNRLLVYSDSASELDLSLDSIGMNEGVPIYREVKVNRVDFRVLTMPLQVEGNQVGYLQVGLALTEIREAQRFIQIVFSVAVVFSILVAEIVGWLVTGHALAPLQTMVQVTRQISSSDDLSRRIPVIPGRSDEINELILAFNRTLVRLERLFDAQRRFLADVSHELRTPLTVIKGNVGLMRLMKSPDAESLDSIDSEVDRLTRLVGDLLLMAQAETGKLPLSMAPVALDDLLFEVFNQLKILSKGEHDIQIEKIEPVRIIADRDRIKQVLLNLGSNAIKFTPRGGKIHLSLEALGKWVRIQVSDEGAGISKDEMNHLFERFYKADKARGRVDKQTGFGLGLPIAYWIVRNHGGRIDVESEPGAGTTFHVWLPLSLTEIPTQPSSLNSE